MFFFTCLTNIISFHAKLVRSVITSRFKCRSNNDVFLDDVSFCYQGVPMTRSDLFHVLCINPGHNEQPDIDVKCNDKILFACTT